MFSIHIVIGILLGFAAMLPGQALAQVYRPHGFDRSDNAAQLELEIEAREGFDAFGERRAKTNKEKERPSEAWTMFGRLGLVSVEKDDGFTLKRSGPKLGRLTIGIRKRF